MILQQLKQYIEENGPVSRTQLARQFHMSEDGVDAMLGVWINKGVLSRTVDTNATNHIMRIRYNIQKPDSLSLNVIM